MKYDTEDLNKLNRMVAEHIFNYRHDPICDYTDDLPNQWGYDGEGNRIYEGEIPNYTTDISAAMDIINKLKIEFNYSIHGGGLGEDTEDHCCCELVGSGEHVKFESEWVETPELAICLAALKAKGIDWEKELRL